jgi:ribosomal protein S12 methylthiotransferase accessory factor
MSLISISRKSGIEFAIDIGAHSLTSDMSESDGGQNNAPSPSELLVGSLGACIAMMVQRYCDRHGYTDGEVSASLTYELAENPTRLGAVTIDLEIPQDVPEDKRDVVLRIAEACPIHATLEQPPDIDMEIV